jgi:hypothetical protein
MYKFHKTRTKKEREEKYENTFWLIGFYIFIMVIGLAFTGGQ